VSDLFSFGSATYFALWKRARRGEREGESEKGRARRGDESKKGRRRDII